jgi:hypothetical protein
MTLKWRLIHLWVWEQISDWIPTNAPDFLSPMRNKYCTYRYLQEKLKVKNQNHLQECSGFRAAKEIASNQHKQIN